MKVKFFIIASVCLLLSSCGERKMSITQYNEAAVGVFNKSSERVYEEREILFDRELSDEENQKIVEGLNQLLDSCINYMNGLNYPEEATDFHNSMLHLYQFQKDSIMPLLSESITYPAQSKDFYRVWREFDKRTKRVDQMLNEMEKYQRELAKKANAQLR